MLSLLENDFFAYQGIAMSEAIIQALRRKYMENIGNPAAQLIGGGVRGYLGLDAPAYADGLGMEAYRNAAAIGNTPVVGMPSMAVRAGARAAPAVAESLRKHAKGFQEYNRALGPAGVSQATVWHGSPHKFDAFDASKIGTGEGSQAYGHGLYLADNPTVANSYRAMAGNPGRRQAGLSGAGADQVVLDSTIQLTAKQFTGGDVAKLAELIQRKPGAFTNPEGLLKRIAEYEGNSPPSFIYKVDLPDEKIARMLDWDKPLSQQPKTFQDLVSGLPRFQDSYVASKTTAGEAYGELAGKLGNRAKASEALRQAGIPGIRYLDAGSRGASQGTSNFVVFPGEEAALTILERNNEIINALRRKKPD